MDTIHLLCDYAGDGNKGPANSHVRAWDEMSNSRGYAWVESPCEQGDFLEWL